MTAGEAAALDFQRQKEAMAQRMQSFGIVKATPGEDEITDYDRRLYGRPIRIEVDCAIPIPDLKRQLNTIRAELTNALIELETERPANDRRFTVHRRLSAAKTYVRQSRDEIKLRSKSTG